MPKLSRRYRTYVSQHHEQTPRATVEEEKYLVTVPTTTEGVGLPVIRALISPAYGPEGRLQIAIDASLALGAIADTRGSLHSNRSYFKGL